MGWSFESASKAKKKKRAFLSFIKEDEPPVNGLRLLNANDDFDIEFYDESLRTPIDSDEHSFNIAKCHGERPRS